MKEMKKELLKLTGIQRNRKLRKFDDGSLNESVNLRFRNGVWEAVGDKEVFEIVSAYGGCREMLAFHPVGNAQNLIFITSTNVIVSWDVVAKKTAQVLTDYSQVLVTNVGANGEYYKAVVFNNILMIHIETALLYFIWKDGKYVEATASFPDFSIRRVINNAEPQWYLTRDNYYDLGTGHIAKVHIGDGSAGQTIDFLNGHSNRINSDGRIPDFDKLLGLVISRKEVAQNSGIPIGPVYLCATIEFFDGSEVYHTPPVLTSFGDIVITHNNSTNTTTYVAVRTSETYINIENAKFSFHIYGVNNNPIVKNVHFYISRPRTILTEYYDETRKATGMGAKSIARPWGYYYTGGATLKRAFSVVYEDQALLKDQQFFRIGSISVDEIPSTGIVSVKFENVNNLETYKHLPLDNLTHHNISAKNSTQYNGHLFLSNIATKLRKPCKLTDHDVRTGHKPLTIGGPQAVVDFYMKVIQRVPYDSADNPHKADFYIDIQDVGNEVGGHMTKFYLEPGGGASAQLLGYYGNHALNHKTATFHRDTSYQIEGEVTYRISLKTEEGDTIQVVSDLEVIRTYSGGWELGEIGSEFKKWYFYLPLAGAITYPDIRAYKVDVYMRFIRHKMSGSDIWTPYPPNEGQYGVASAKMVPSQVNNFAVASFNTFITYSAKTAMKPNATAPTHVETPVYDNNRVQASALNNPFVFPAKNSYRVGDSEIIGLQTINNALSEGQFGDYPMIAFTKSGIWAMQIGHGDLLVSSVVPLANEVCTNPDSITAIRKGLMFVTEEGLKVLRGREVKNISEIIQGRPDNDIRSGAILRDVFNKGGYESMLSTSDFKDYIKTAQIGYDDYYEEIIVSNPAKHHSYVFSLERNTWHKTDWRFDGFSCKFPYLFGYRGDKVVLMNKETREPKKALLLTNSFGFNNSFAKFEQMTLRGRFGSGRAMVFGSTDQNNWNLLSVMTTAGGWDIRLPRGFYTCKYFVLFLDGKWEHDSYLEDIEAEVKVRYQRKIR